MATALFITRDDIVKNTILDGNVDTDKFIQFIKIAQEIHIRNYLGTKLYDKISADIVASNLTGNYLTLVNTYLKPMLIHFAMVDYLPFSAYQLKNGGLGKHISESSENISTSELNMLINKEQDFASYYTERFLDYICNNSSLFPEYNQNVSGDVYPDRDADYQSWVL